MKYRVYLFGDENSGLDISRYVSEVPAVIEERAIGQEKILSVTYEIIVNNFSGFFSGDGPKSIIKGVNYLYRPIYVYKYNVLIWVGLLTDISRDYREKTVRFFSVSSLYKFKDIKIEYTSLDWETPGEIIKAIFDNYGYTDYSPSQIAATIGANQAAGIYVKAAITKELNMFLCPGIEKLAEVACAEVYARGNLTVIQPFAIAATGAQVAIGAADITDDLIITSTEDRLINDYRITYSGGAVTDGEANNLGTTSRALYGAKEARELSGGADDCIIIRDRRAAIGIGEAHITHGHYGLPYNPRARQRIELSVKAKFSELITLKTFLKLTYGPEGWADKVFEVARTENNQENDNIIIEALEI